MWIQHSSHDEMGSISSVCHFSPTRIHHSASIRRHAVKKKLWWWYHKISRLGGEDIGLDDTPGKTPVVLAHQYINSHRIDLLYQQKYSSSQSSHNFYIYSCNRLSIELQRMIFLSVLLLYV